MSAIATNSQTIDLGVDRAYLESYFAQCGYWGDAGRRRRHAFVLSPSAYLMSAEQEASLERLGRATYATVATLNQRLCALPKEKHLSHEDAALLRFANRASHGLLSPSDGEVRVPPAFKVDLVQDAQGRFFIVEVDVYNPRGYGYAAMLEESVSGISSARRFPGIEGLRRLVCAHGAGEAPLSILVSEFERYYETGFGILCDALSRCGVDARVILEREFMGCATSLEGVLFAVPDSLHQYPAVRGVLMGRYHDKTLRFVYPPVSYLGSKAFLPFLREQEGMSEFIPKTALVSKKHKAGTESLLASGGPLVLKAVISSGMKGVFFSDIDHEAFPGHLAQARSVRDPSWVLQEQVPQVPTPVVVFDEHGARMVGDYYLRLIAYVTADGILDVEITGRPDRKVHGAPDCIQLPVVLS